MVTSPGAYRPYLRFLLPPSPSENVHAIAYSDDAYRTRPKDTI